MKKIFRPKNCNSCPCYERDDWGDTGYCGFTRDFISVDVLFWPESMRMPTCKVISITIETEDD